MHPLEKPQTPLFSSGPTRKFPGWSLDKLSTTSLGRSHRSAYGLERIHELIARTRSVLKIPDNYEVALLPGSCSGAMEAALWNLLGPRPTDFVAFDVFGKLWTQDGFDQLKVQEARMIEAKAGFLPDLSKVNSAHDIVFTWNGTSTGVCVPNADWISSTREGIVICDATSSLFAMSFPWKKMDAVAFSWQKSIGGEAGHGMLVLSPRAVARLNTYAPPWPIPRVLRLRDETGFAKRIFEGMTINTPSLLCIEDCIEALKWCEEKGGLEALILRSQANLHAVEEWVAQTPWIDFLARDPKTRSSTSICLYFPENPDSWDLPKAIASCLEKEGAAYDILGHIRAVPSLRIWGGPMVETSDIKALLPWITWAYEEIR